MKSNNTHGSVRGWLTVLLYLAMLAGSLPVLSAVKFQQGNGIVTMRIVANRSVAEFNGKWASLTVRNVATKKKYRLLDESPRASAQSLFVGQLPPGSYEVLEVGAAINVSIREWADFNPKLFIFPVEANRLTNLGSLIYLRPYFPVNTRRFRWVFEKDPGLPQILSYLVDDPGKGVLASEPLSWTSAEGVERPRLTPETKHLSMVLTGRAVRPDGTMLFGESFGQIASRDPAGHWSWEDTGLFDTIQTVFEGEDGTMYAMADNSVLLAREAKGPWHRLEIPLLNALPRFLLDNGAQGRDPAPAAPFAHSCCIPGRR